MARGYIEKRGDNYRIRWRTKSGIHRSETVGPRKKDAEHLLAERLREVSLGIVDIKTCRVEDFAPRWLDVYVRPNYAHSTYMLYRDRLRAHILPNFGRKAFEEIHTDSVRLFASKLVSNGLSPATVNAIIRQLRVFFKHAREERLLRHDPCVGVSVRVGRNRKEKRFLSLEELFRLADSVDARYRSLVLTAGLTGLRQGELFALHWEDIDFERAKLHVKASLSYGELKEPKSHASERTVILCDEVEQALREHQLATGKRKGPVWTAPGGGFISKDNFRKRVFQPAVERAGLIPLRFHDLRHTFVAFLFECGMGKNPLFVQRTLGHSKIDTTFGVYGHLFPSAEEEAREAMSQLVRSKNVYSTVDATLRGSE